MNNFLVKDFENKDIEYSLNEYNFDEKTLYIAPIEFKNDNPVYMADALNFYQNVDKIGGINAEILVKRDNYTRLTYDFVSIYLGMFIGVGLFALGHFLYDLLKNRKKIDPNEDIYINFKYLDIEEGKVYEYSGDFSGLKKLTPDILQKIEPLLK